MSSTSSGTSSGTRLRGVRGATCVDRDESEVIRDATRDLLTQLLARNAATPDQVVSAFFTVTPDITSEFPARAARDMGWNDVAMLCSVEIPVPGAMQRVVRVLLHLNVATDATVRHVYLNGAEELRPDR